MSNELAGHLVDELGFSNNMKEENTLMGIRRGALARYLIRI